MPHQCQSMSMVSDRVVLRSQRIPTYSNTMNWAACALNPHPQNVAAKKTAIAEARIIQMKNM